MNLEQSQCALVASSAMLRRLRLYHFSTCDPPISVSSRLAKRWQDFYLHQSDLGASICIPNSFPIMTTLQAAETNDGDPTTISQW